MPRLTRRKRRRPRPRPTCSVWPSWPLRPTPNAPRRSTAQTLAAENRQYEILLVDAQRRLARDEKLSKTSSVSLSEVEDRRTEVAGMEAKIAWTQQRRIEAEQQIAVVEAQAAAAHAAVASAEARQRSVEARVKVLQSQRDEYFIRSPFDGMVTEKAAEVGEIVAPISIGGSMARGSIVTIADWATLQAEVDVAEAQLGGVKPGQRSAISVDAIPDKIFPGRVRRILPHADRSKATVKVRVDFSLATTWQCFPTWACESGSWRMMRRPAWKPVRCGTRLSFPRQPSLRTKTAVSCGWSARGRLASGRPRGDQFRRENRDRQRRQRR